MNYYKLLLSIPINTISTFHRLEVMAAIRISGSPSNHNNVDNFRSVTLFLVDIRFLLARIIVHLDNGSCHLRKLSPSLIQILRYPSLPYWLFLLHYRWHIFWWWSDLGSYWIFTSDFQALCTKYSLISCWIKLCKISPNDLRYLYTLKTYFKTSRNFFYKIWLDDTIIA